MLSHGRTFFHQINSLPLTNPFYGIWRVDEFTADGQARPPLLTDNLRWQRVIFDSLPGLSPKMIATIQEMNGQFSPYVATPDTNNGILSLRSPSNADLNIAAVRLLIHTNVGEQGNAQLNYNRLSPDAMTLEGVINGHRLHVMLKKEEREFALKTQRFHWIIEEKDVTY
jgi:hypothetical protein